MNNNWYLYMHRNKINSKVYIGITGQSLERRWQNGLGYQGCPYFYKAIQKYGWDGFDHIVLMENLSELEAKNHEVEFISKYQSMNPLYGYNVSPGGSLGLQNIDRDKFGLIKMRIPVYCVELKQPFESLSQASKITGINRRIIRNACEGIYEEPFQYHWNYLVDMDYIEMDFSNADFNLCFNLNSISLPVVCIELKTIYPSSGFASNLFDVDRNQIKKCALDNSKTAAGYHWKYLKDIDNESKQNFCIDFKYHEHIGPKRNKPFICVETLKVYQSVGEAAKEFNTSRPNIRTSLHDCTKTACGYHFKYLDT